MNSVVLESYKKDENSNAPNEKSELKESEVLENNLLGKDNQFYDEIASQESDEAESEDLSSDSSDEDGDV